MKSTQGIKWVIVLIGVLAVAILSVLLGWDRDYDAVTAKYEAVEIGMQLTVAREVLFDMQETSGILHEPPFSSSTLIGREASSHNWICEDNTSFSTPDYWILISSDKTTQAVTHKSLYKRPNTLTVASRRLLGLGPK